VVCREQPTDTNSVLVTQNALVPPDPAVTSEERAEDTEPLRLPHSLRFRLPFLLTTLIVALSGAFLWTTYIEVRRAVLEAGSERAEAAAEQVANLLGQSTARSVNEIRRVSHLDVIRQFLTDPKSLRGEAVLQQVKSLATTGQSTIELRDLSGRLLLETRGNGSEGSAAEAVPAPSAVVRTAGISEFRSVKGIISYEVVAEVPAADESGPPLGTLIVRRTLSAPQTLEFIARLVGTGALVVIGNRSGDVWTDLSKRVPSPPVETPTSSLTAYRAASGEQHLGKSALVADTPWAVWVGFPDAAILAPARGVLRRMLLIGLAFVGISALFGLVFSARITTPLAELTTASQLIAHGDYSKRVSTTRRRDEIGHLGTAFNTMAACVEEGRRTLEDRVQQRTARLEAAMQELDQFFSLSIDLFCIASTDGQFKRVSPAWEKTLGWPANELMAVPYLTFVHPEDEAATVAEARKLATGGLTVHFENRYRCRDGSYRWLSWTAAGVLEDGLVFATARDVTEHKRIASELQKRVDELNALNQELEAFTYSVSHDLRAPLRHITGFASLLDGSATARLNDEDRRRLGVITEAAARMGRLIDDLLAFSRLGRAAPVAQRVRLDDIAREVRKELAARSNDNHVRWIVGPLPDVHADPAMMRVVMMNLVSNALKYSHGRSTPEIEIGSTRDGGDSVVFVRDNGVGFDMQYAHKLFGVFQRLHGSDEFEGTGIGLATVRRIIHRHGGHTWAQGQVDHGATFYFSLPGTGSVTT
jgi:PAS domain S-box-containing protein